MYCLFFVFCAVKKGGNFFMDQNIIISFPPNVPKYLAVADAIRSAIRDSKLIYGQQLPSINELSEAHLLSRDTVEKAYKELRRRGIIESVKGKGYFINRVDVDASMQVLLIFNKISNYKRQIYNAFVNTLGKNAKVDLQIHHWSSQILKNILSNALGKYDYYVIMPHFYEHYEKAMELLEKIPKEQLILLDRNVPELENNCAAVYQDFREDIIEALEQATPLLKKYKKLIYINPSMVPYPPEIMKGFCYFCKMNNFDFSIIGEMDENTSVNEGDAYIVIEETDLVNLIKVCNNRNLRIGKDVGIISYNETPLKEILLNGITVISTDHECMGRTAAQLILDQRIEKIKNPFTLIKRKSV